MTLITTILALIAVCALFGYAGVLLREVVWDIKCLDDPPEDSEPRVLR